ncbi:MAG: alanine--tRNA ligase [Eubacteriaceae bacterium]
MKEFSLNEIRELFLNFFEKKDHVRLPSAPLVPINDNSLLLINSGMAPLKSYFTGDEKPPGKRVTTCQKCIRTPDIENVGKTARHGTFFEMLGNFSFGNYFKKEAIAWGWEFVTKEMEIPLEKLYVSIYENDDETYEIWKNQIGLPNDKIVRLGKEDNFWEHGLGPCGPCSEIYYDRGSKYGCDNPNCSVGCDCDRYIEFWNLVFTQFDKDEQGNYNTLANPNIDTGMGLERMATIMQGVDTIFEVDTIKQIMNKVCELAKVKYSEDEKVDISIRVITDHIRSVTFMVGDGVLPSNEGRGYVLRRLLRRAARHGKLLGIEGLFLYNLSKEVEKVSGKAYPEINEKLDYIVKIIKIEEEKFQETIDQGLIILEEEIRDLQKNNEKVLSGKSAFKLYDTFGFPLDLTKDILDEENLLVDEVTFNEEMKKQKERARKARLEKDIEVWKDDPFEYMDSDISTEFVGYDNLICSSSIIGIVNEGIPKDKVVQGDKVLILLNSTTFYAESGGQKGDKGQLITDTGIVEVYDCKKGSLGRHIHYGKVIKGEILINQVSQVKVDSKNRLSVARNHTSTHLLQKSLKEVLGDHVAQAGSLVDSKRLRFDFNHFEKLTDEELLLVENNINNVIYSSLEVKVFETDINTAKELGATALFGEKYGDIVRVVKIGEYSTELCGGTHLKNASEAGLFKIISESGIASGVRRIEAVTGYNAYEYVNNIEKEVNDISQVLKVKPENIMQRIEDALITIKDLEKENKILKQKLNRGLIDNYIENFQTIEGIKSVITVLDDLSMDDLRKIADQIRDKIQSGIVLLGSSNNDKVNFVAMATKDVVKKGFHAGKLIKEVASITGGGGGGRPDMAQAGGKDSSKLNEALKAANLIILKQLEK